MAVPALAPVLCMARTEACTGPWVRTGWVYRVGTWEGNTGTQHQGPLTRAEADTSEAGPGSPCQGAGVGGYLLQRPQARPPSTHPFGARSVPCWALPGAGWALRRLWANKGEIPSYFAES